MIISVASGKGGTGKTTIATNLAASMEQDVMLLDCDVEEPNAHLFFSQENPVSTESFAYVPTVNNMLCDGCGACSEICQFNALATVGQTVLSFSELCHSCRGCELVCPQKAITAGQRMLGTIEESSGENIHFVKGTLRIGEAMAPPLIKDVLAKITGDMPVIVDAPPGTSCPVITAMKGSDFVLLVTEPTPFGLHDLKLAVEVVKELGLPHGLVINRAGLGFEKVHDYAREEGIEVLLEIPFDREIAWSYSNGKLFSQEIPKWQTAFRTLHKSIEGKVEAHRRVL